MYSWRYIVISHGGFFVLTMVLATGIGALGLWKNLAGINHADIRIMGILAAIGG